MKKEKENWHNKKTKDLFEAVLKLKTTDECRRFFRDLCTLEEIQNMEDRWEIARLLDKKKLSYRQIARKTGMSTTTISRISWWIRHGEGGYKLILDRMKKK